MIPKKIEYLIDLYFSNRITEIQKKELARWILDHQDDEVISLLEQAWYRYIPGKSMPDEMSNEIIAKLFSSEIPKGLPEPITKVVYIERKLRWWKPAIAAASVILLIFIGYLWLSPRKGANLSGNMSANNYVPNNDLKPGGQRAVLTLSNGSQIVLDSANTGLVAQQGNTKIVKLASGQVKYNVIGTPTSAISYNIMSTPNGGMYQVQLSDGSKVWLNSASSIRYPTEFTTQERRVQITGEAYFEVAKDIRKPFIVATDNGIEVKVLGTHFNVNSYNDDDEIKTTLLQGKIKISSNKASSLLIPGEQAGINRMGSIRLVKNVDMDEVMAWKDGFFQYNNAKLSLILKQIARWYNVQINYSGSVPDDAFSGKISMSVNLSKLLEWLKLSGVHFKVEGKNIIINP